MVGNESARIDRSLVRPLALAFWRARDRGVVRPSVAGPDGLTNAQSRSTVVVVLRVTRETRPSGPM